MKKVFNFILILFFMIILFGCNQKKCLVTFTIDFEEQIVEINRGSILNYNLISSYEENEIEGFYYDGNYSLKYDFQEINDDTTIYVKTNRIEVTLVVIYKNIKIKVSQNKPIKIEDISKYAEPYEIEGLYYDCRFTQPYNDEGITEETTIFVDTNISIENAKQIGEIYTIEYFVNDDGEKYQINRIEELYKQGYLSKENIDSINKYMYDYHGGVKESDNNIWITEDLMIQLIYDKAIKYDPNGEKINELIEKLNWIINNFYYLGTYNDYVVFRAYGQGWSYAIEYGNLKIDDMYIRMYEGPGLYVWKPVGTSN